MNDNQRIMPKIIAFISYLFAISPMAWSFSPFVWTISPFVWTISPLQAMVSFEATASTVLKSVNNEVFNEGTILNAIARSHYISSDIISSGLLGIALYSKINKIDDVDNKWQTITLYNETKKNINKIVLIFMIIFTKNIENAI